MIQKHIKQPISRARLDYLSLLIGSHDPNLYISPIGRASESQHTTSFTEIQLATTREQVGNKPNHRCLQAACLTLNPKYLLHWNDNTNSSLREATPGDLSNCHSKFGLGRSRTFSAPPEADSDLTPSSWCLFLAGVPTSFGRKLPLPFFFPTFHRLLLNPESLW